MQKMHRLDVQMDTLNICLFHPQESDNKLSYTTIGSFRNVQCHFFNKTINGQKNKKAVI